MNVNDLPRHRVTVGAAVLNDDRNVLLIRGPHRGWELPGGHVEEGESLEEALIREIEEETGIIVEIVRLCGITQEVHSGILNIFWLAKPVGGTIRTSKESLEVKYVSLDDALGLITNDDFREELNQIVSAENHPFYMIFNS